MNPAAQCWQLKFSVGVDTNGEKVVMTDQVFSDGRIVRLQGSMLNGIKIQATPIANPAYFLFWDAGAAVDVHPLRKNRSVRSDFGGLTVLLG